MSKDECPSCGVKWEDHKGVVWTCEDLQKFRYLTYELCLALLDKRTRLAERTLRVGVIIDAIRNVDPDSYDKVVGVPCEVV